MIAHANSESERKQERGSCESIALCVISMLLDMIILVIHIIE